LTWIQGNVTTLIAQLITQKTNVSVGKGREREGKKNTLLRPCRVLDAL